MTNATFEDIRVIDADTHLTEPHDLWTSHAPAAYRDRVPQVRDVDCDFRLMRRSIFERVRLEKNSGVICLEMMKKIQDAGFTIVEAPVHHYHRTHGQSQFFNFRRVIRTGIDVLKLWYALVVRRTHQQRLAPAGEDTPRGSAGLRVP